MKKTDKNPLTLTLKKFRKLKRMSQSDAAEMIGMSVRGYQKYEQGESWPGPDKLATIASLYDVSIADLLGENPKEWAEGGLLSIYKEKHLKDELMDTFKKATAHVLSKRHISFTLQSGVEVSGSDVLDRLSNLSPLLREDVLRGLFPELAKSETRNKKAK